jgi:hypothetical protein
MALKFLYINNDPFVNESEEFVRILAIAIFPSSGSSGGLGVTGVLYDQAGNGVANMMGFTDEVFTESTAYPYSFSNSFPSNQIIIVPPGWSFRNFLRAVAVQGSLEEVLRVH